MKKRITALITAAALLFSGCSSGEKTYELTDGKLNIYIFSAGKADAALFYTDSHAVLIDCGEKGFGKEILAFMDENDIDSLDCMIITHFDKDHVGGAAKILGSVEVGQVFQSNCPKDSEEYEKYVKRLDECGITPQTVRETVEVNFGAANFIIDPPAQETYETDPSNNSSLITTVELGYCTMLFAGDAEDDRMAEFTQANEIDCDLLKVPYHGHYQDGLKSFVESVDPEYAVMTCSDEEPEDEKTVKLLKKAGAKTFVTRKNAVRVSCDGVEVTVEYDD